MEKITVLGHKKQDTDATCAAISLAELLNKAKKYKALAKILDKPNKETIFVMNRFKIKTPAKFSLTAKKQENVFLVDFNEEEQSPAPFDKINIEGLVDHHKLNISFSKEYPIIFRVEPVGSSCTLVAKMYKDWGVVPAKKIASLLLAGIVSDTLLFSSPTTTKEDKQIADSLAKIANVNPKEFSREMFEAKSDLSGIKPEEIITIDYKEFDFGGKKTGIGVLETVDPLPALSMEEKIKESLLNYKKKQKLDLIFFGVVDIFKSKTVLVLVEEAEKQAARRAFGEKIKDDKMELLGVVSRKKQLVPAFIKNI